jgi:hypothetical protein
LSEYPKASITRLFTARHAGHRFPSALKAQIFVFTPNLVNLNPFTAGSGLAWPHSYPGGALAQAAAPLRHRDPVPARGIAAHGDAVSAGIATHDFTFHFFKNLRAFWQTGFPACQFLFLI